METVKEGFLRRFFVALVLAAALACACTLAACGDRGGESNSHEHTYSSEWTNDSEFHWHASTCGHAEEIAGKAAHDGDPCSACGYHEHTYSGEWTHDSEFHWHASTCGHDSEISSKGAHSGNPCADCGYLAPTEGLAYSLNTDGETCSVVGIGTAKGSRIIIADEYEGKPVVAVADDAFKNQIINDEGTVPNEIRSFAIPDSVTYIGKFAFYNCIYVTEIEFGAGVKKIQGSAFGNCTALESATLPDGLEYIEADAFEICESLTEMEIPSGVKTINGSIFPRCTSLEKITVASGNENYRAEGNCIIEIATGVLVQGCNKSVIPSDGSVKAIGSGAFNWCDKLASVKIPQGVESIGERAFYRCPLTFVDLPEGVKTVGVDAFYGCSSLTSIVVPASLLNVQKQAFYTSGLTKVYYKGTETQWSGITVDKKGGTLMSGGNDKFIKATRYYYSESRPSSGNGWHYDADGKVVEW